MPKTVTVPPVFKLDCCKVGYVVAYGKHSHKGVLADADSILTRTTSPPLSKVSLRSSFLCSSAVPPLRVHFTSDRHCHIYSPQTTHRVLISPHLSQSRSIPLRHRAFMHSTPMHYHTTAMHTTNPLSSSPTFVGVDSPSTRTPLRA